jgi:universal stress protein A
MPTIKRILVPVDFSSCSRVALEHAVTLAEQFGASVDVVHVWPPPRSVGPDTVLDVFRKSSPTLGEDARASASKEMEQFLTPFQKKGTIKFRLRIECGEPYQRILEIANGGVYDLIAMGTHGRTGLSHVVMGSVAEKVVRHSLFPVLTVRTPQITKAGPS